MGSVGTRAWVMLLMGRDHDDALFLQAKEAEASVLEEFVGKSGYASHGERVVAGQHLMQAASDIFLGYQQVTGPDGMSRDYYVRQLRDWKGSFEVEGSDPARSDQVRRGVRPGSGTGPRPLGRPDRHCQLSRQRPLFERQLPSSPKPTPTRTSGTTRPSRPQRPAVGSLWSRACRAGRRPGTVTSRRFPCRPGDTEHHQQHGHHRGVVSQP